MKSSGGRAAGFASRVPGQAMRLDGEHAAPVASTHVPAVRRGFRRLSGRFSGFLRCINH
ncbi:hypothetical protein BRPE64_ACDS17860 [Caballeronia insecticola]|uniref:Uncharacterized protein n=1 Tax=Caballeronia insecticola TaxID=758793 RepID=R4WRH1_9BURK|nr:hypothetical protein BRPE64_ACDS17860 [Caballeronia insecticola]